MKIQETGRQNIQPNVGNNKFPSKYTNINNKNNVNTPVSFNGAGVDAAFNVLNKGFQCLDKNAMIQVSFVDTVSTNIPRTVVDLKTGLAAALETCRREFSGLFVNCLMPGLVVMGIAGLLPKTKALRGTDTVTSWANAESCEKFKEVYKAAQASDGKDTAKEYVRRSLSSIEGLDGKTFVKYADKASEPEFSEAVDLLTEAVSTKGMKRKELVKNAKNKLASLTKAENVLKFNDKPAANLSETLRDMVDLGGKFETVKSRAVKSAESAEKALSGSELNEKISGALDKYSSSLKSFVNKKSFLGLGVVLGIAVSVQAVNRAITRKQFNADGAPIYKDFGKKQTKKEMTEEEKHKFTLKKLAASMGMFGLAALSMIKKPTVGMFQFSNIFPTMDQCRWIASFTFASRMMCSEDENELRETTVRDVASFSGLYFLGDYVKKGVASGMEAFSKTKRGAKILGKDVVLLNRLKEVEKPVISSSASFTDKALQSLKFRGKQFGNWIKNTELKTASEVSSTKIRNLRNLCRVSDIAFSIMMLGILLPKHNRKVTEKKVEEAKKREEALNNPLKSLSEIKSEKVPDIFSNML